MTICLENSLPYYIFAKTIITSQYIYIIEVKLDSTPEVALQQIEEKLSRIELFIPNDKESFSKVFCYYSANKLSAPTTFWKMSE
jgi:hypothetical protein